ncbi:MAG: antibiotic biosynthesis monooxygenase family protein [Planctomycetaceae bacterium]
MPEPAYYAVIFTSIRSAEDSAGYAAMSERMAELAAAQPGFLGVESARGSDGLGITVSYWQSLDAIRRWRENVEHRVAQSQGRELWYRRYRLRVCRVERDMEFESGLKQRTPPCNAF